ncbi:16133_t:CDS:1, partial [Racocetra persica]
MSKMQILTLRMRNRKRTNDNSLLNLRKNKSFQNSSPAELELDDT